MRLSLIRAAIAIGARAIKPVAEHTTRIVTRPCFFLQSPPFSTPFATSAANAHARCFHLVTALCQKEKKFIRKHKRGCPKKRKCKKRGCVKNPRICLEDVKDIPKTNPHCCPCEEKETMDPYRRQ